MVEKSHAQKKCYFRASSRSLGACIFRSFCEEKEGVRASMRAVHACVIWRQSAAHASSSCSAAQQLSSSAPASASSYCHIGEHPSLSRAHVHHLKSRLPRHLPTSLLRPLKIPTVGWPPLSLPHRSRPPEPAASCHTTLACFCSIVRSQDGRLDLRTPQPAQARRRKSRKYDCRFTGLPGLPRASCCHNCERRRCCSDPLSAAKPTRPCRRPPASSPYPASALHQRRRPCHDRQGARWPCL